MIIMDAKEGKIIEDILKKIEDVAKSLFDDGLMGIGLSLRSYSDTLRAVMGLENEEE